jgi:hypothetical protein
LQLKGADLISDSSDSSDSEDDNSEDDNYVPPAKRTCSALEYSLDEMRKIIQLYDDPNFHGNRFKRVTNRFKLISSRKQISRYFNTFVLFSFG